jgi:ribosomal-protein-alanine N-acetyltransferase
MIRLAQQKDLNDILRIERTAFKKYQFDRNQIKYLITKGRGIFLVTVAGDFVHSYIYCVITKRSKYARIHSIATICPRKGNATMMILKAEEILKKMKKKGMTLDVDVKNKKAIKLYKKMGYKMIKHKENYYGRGEHADRYRRDFLNER